MNFDTLSSIAGTIGSLGMLLIGISLASVIYRLRHPEVRERKLPPRILYTLVVTACVIAMVCAALRAWQFSLIGH